MVRQCAWCLRLIDANGERISPAPLPKLYEASHGMCGICGKLWIEQVMGGRQRAQSVLPSISSSTLSTPEKAEKAAEPDEPVQAIDDLPLFLL